jgi:hypothetical protein
MLGLLENAVFVLLAASAEVETPEVIFSLGFLVITDVLVLLAATAAAAAVETTVFAAAVVEATVFFLVASVVIMKVFPVIAVFLSTTN